MNHSLGLSEKQALLVKDNVPNGHYESPVIHYNGRRVSVVSKPVINGALDTTPASYTIIQRSDGNHFSKGIPIWRATLLVVNSALGAGILNFPQAYAQCGGIFTALIIHMCLLVFIMGAFLILAYCAENHGSHNFQEIIRAVLGPRAYVATQIVITLYMFGCTVAYMILIGDQLEKVGEAIESAPGWYLQRKFLIGVASLVFLLPLCLPKTLRVLSYSSFFGTFAAFFVSIVTVIKYFEGHHSGRKDFNRIEEPWTTTFSSVPIICFAFQCHVQSVAVYAELKRASVPRFGIVVVVAMTICSILYIITGTFGYLTFGTNVASDVLKNYPPNGILVNTARVTLCLIILPSSAVVVFCGRSCLDGLYVAAFSVPTTKAETDEKRQRVIQILAWIGLSLIISIYMQDVLYAITFVGGLAALFIFFYPGICLVQEMLQYPVLTLTRKLLIVLGACYVTIGVFLFAYSEVFSIMEDIKGKVGS